MTVQGKDIFSFSSAGYPGDIVLSFDDLTIDHPEFMRLDGGEYKRNDYPQIEMHFSSDNTNCYKQAVEISNVSGNMGSGDNYKWIVDKYDDTIAVAFIKKASSSYTTPYYYYWLSKDNGKTYTTIFNNVNSSGLGYPADYEKMIRWKDKTLILNRNSESNKYEVYTICYYIKDSDKKINSATASKGTYKGTSLDFRLLDNYLFYQHIDGSDNTKFHLMYADLNEETILFKELDVGTCDISNIQHIGVIKGSNQLIIGNLSKQGKIRIYEKDLTYAEYDFEQLKDEETPINYIFAQCMFFKDGEYIAFSRYKESNYYHIAITKDFLTWEVKKAPFGFDNLISFAEFADGYFFCEEDGSKNIYNVICLTDKFDRSGTRDSINKLMPDKSYISIISCVETDESGPYVYAAYYKKTSDTVMTSYIYKLYLRNPNKWFKTTDMTNFANNVFGGGTKKRPFLRTE